MIPRALGCAVRRVLLLFAEPLMDGSHAPIAEPARRVLAMELAVLGVARITGERGPNLTRHAFVPRDRDDVGIAHVIGTQKIDIARRRRSGHDLLALLVRREASELALPASPRDISRGTCMSGEKCGVGEEVRDAMCRERLLEARL